MATLKADSVGDLIRGGLRDLGKPKWADISTQLQEFHVLPNLLKKEKVQFGSGTGLQWTVNTAPAGNARQTGLFGVDDVNVDETTAQAYVPWRYTVGGYAVDEREILMNREPSRIIDILRLRKHQGLVDLAQQMETQFWQDDSAITSDDVYSAFYWATTNTSTTPAFNGGIPTGFSDVAGVSPTTYTGWNNWAGSYATESKSDLVRKMRKAMVFTNFMAPVPFPDINRGGIRRAVYMKYETRAALEELAEQQNDNIGKDIASFDGVTMFRGIPLMWVPAWESGNSAARTDNPVLGIDWNTMFLGVLSGDYLTEVGPGDPANSTQPRVHKYRIYTTWNVCCRERRRLFNLIKV